MLNKDLFLSRSVFILGIDKPNCSIIVPENEREGKKKKKKKKNQSDVILNNNSSHELLPLSPSSPPTSN